MRAARRFRPEGEAPFRVTAAFIQPVRGPLTPTLSPQAGRGSTLRPLSRQCLIFTRSEAGFGGDPPCDEANAR